MSQVQEEKVIKIGLFDWLGSVQSTGKDLSQGGDPVLLKSYEPFMINRGCVQSLDCLMFAAEANKTVIADKYMHYKFMLNAITKKKRFSKWAKKEDPNDAIDMICLHFNVNRERGLEYFNLMGEAGIAALRAERDPGGSVKVKK